MKISIFSILFLVLIYTVSGNVLTLYENPMPNYQILFYNLNTSTEILVETDNLGRFDLSNYRLTDNHSREDSIIYAIGYNLSTFKYSGKVHNIDGNITAAGIFPAINKIENLNIGINTLPLDSLSPELTLACKDDNLYFCFLSLSADNQGLLSYESFSPKQNGTTYHVFQPQFNRKFSPGLYFVSMLTSDNSNVYLSIGKYKYFEVSVTNPNVERSKGVIETIEPYCILENGESKIEENFEALETKKYSGYSLTGQPCTTEIVFLKTGDINISTGDINIGVKIALISLGSIISVSLIIGLFFGIRKKNK